MQQKIASAAQDYISFQRDSSIYRKKDVLLQLKIRDASEKFQNQPRPLLRPRSVNFRQHFRNLSRETVPLISQNPSLLKTTQDFLKINNSNEHANEMSSPMFFVSHFFGVKVTRS